MRLVFAVNEVSRGELFIPPEPKTYLRDKEGVLGIKRKAEPTLLGDSRAKSQKGVSVHINDEMPESATALDRIAREAGVPLQTTAGKRE